MRAYSLTHLDDCVLVRRVATLVSQIRTATAELLAHLAELDARRLYAPAGYPSLFAYCVLELGPSEDVAYKHIRAARAARQFPALYLAVADGRQRPICRSQSSLALRNWRRGQLRQPPRDHA